MGWPGPMTHRQELAWAAWEWMDLNSPGKVEQYLMQVACEVVRGNARDASSVHLKDFKLRFQTAGERESRASDDQMKAALIGAFGGGAERRTRTRAEAIAMGLLPPDDPVDEED